MRGSNFIGLVSKKHPAFDKVSYIYLVKKIHVCRNFLKSFLFLRLSITVMHFSQKMASEAILYKPNGIPVCDCDYYVIFYSQHLNWRHGFSSVLSSYPKLER